MSYTCYTCTGCGARYDRDYGDKIPPGFLCDECMKDAAKIQHAVILNNYAQILMEQEHPEIKGAHYSLPLSREAMQIMRGKKS